MRSLPRGIAAAFDLFKRNIGIYLIAVLIKDYDCTACGIILLIIIRFICHRVIHIYTLRHWNLSSGMYRGYILRLVNFESTVNISAQRVVVVAQINRITGRYSRTADSQTVVAVYNSNSTAVNTGGKVESVV